MAPNDGGDNLEPHECVGFAPCLLRKYGVDGVGVNFTRLHLQGAVLLFVTISPSVFLQVASTTTGAYRERLTSEPAQVT